MMPFHCGNELARNRAAEDLIGELKSTAARQRFHANLAVAELAVSPCLLLMAALSLGAAADGFAIRHLGGLERDLRVIALFKARDDGFDRSEEHTSELQS